MTRKILLAVLILVIGVIVYVVIQALTLNEKERAAKHLKALASAVEQEQREIVLNYLDDTYLDRSNMNYEQFVTTLDEFFSYADHISVQIHNLNVTIDSVVGDTAFFASCSLGLRITARHEDDRLLVFGGLVKPTPVRAFFKRTDTYYKLYAAQY